MITAIVNFFSKLSKPQKRDTVAKYEGGVYPHYSYFEWYKCDKCKKEFRREAGYRLLIGAGHGRCIYLCSTCCPSEKRAHLYGINMEYIPPKPKCTPPPPPRKR